MTDFDCVVVGSGAGGAPVALALAEAGFSVLVLEKGPWLTEADFAKDELACCRRSAYTPNLRDEFHVLEQARDDGTWYRESTFDSGWDFWNGNLVGGATNLMSGFFQRQKPKDFRLLAEYGPVADANLSDWPIGYDDLEPFYALVEQRVGVSGRVVAHRFAEPRSTADFPLPPTAEHPVAALVERAAAGLGLTALPLPRAILSRPRAGRGACVYSNYCGSYGCNTGAKGSARSALLAAAIATGRCTVRPWAHAYRLVSDASGRVRTVEYLDNAGLDRHGGSGGGPRRSVAARVVVVACQPIETARLLLLSPGPAHPDGLGNNRGQVGRNLLFSAGGTGSGTLAAGSVAAEDGRFINRTIQDFYEYPDPATGRPIKGGSIEFMFSHANAISRAIAQKRDDDGALVWGRALQTRLREHFAGGPRVRFEVFNDWTPVDSCRVRLDPDARDRYELPVARVQLGSHPRDLEVGRFLSRHGAAVLEAMGAQGVDWSVSASPPQNLVAGGCRFGTDAAAAVLDADCRVFGADNLFVSDGSFMPTGGSVAYTFTIYANAFRVATRIIDQLGGARAVARTREAAGPGSDRPAGPAADPATG